MWNVFLFKGGVPTRSLYAFLISFIGATLHRLFILLSLSAQYWDARNTDCEVPICITSQPTFHPNCLLYVTIFVCNTLSPYLSWSFEEGRSSLLCV